jgi:HEAT repeat protein
MRNEAAVKMSASALIDLLINGTGAEKGKGFEWLDACADVGERERLRALVIYHLTKTHAPPEDPEAESMKRRDARAWMLAALGRVCGDDVAAKGILEQHLSPEFEPNPWGRYWTLEGIVAAGGEFAIQSAKSASRDKDPLVRCLALAVLAGAGDSAALKKLRGEVEHNVWAVLRALRVSMVLDKIILDEVLELVRKGSYEDATYDAIIALGRVPAETPEADEAAEVLGGYVRRYRWPMYDSMRTNALVSLGRLRSVLSVPVLLEELTDENPMIVLQAARAMQAALGARKACRRILEAATEGTRSPPSYAGALRSLDRAEVVDELEAALTTGTTQEADAAMILLRELGGAEALDRLAAMRRSAEAFVAAQSKADEELRKSLDRSLTEARQGFRIVAGMDVTVFVAGLLLLGAGVYLILAGENSFDRLTGTVTSGAGLVGLVLKDWLIKSRDRIEPSVRRLVSLQAAFHGYLRQLRQVDQAYTQRVLEGKLKPEEVSNYTEIVVNATRQTVAFLSEADGPGKERKAAPKPTGSREIERQAADSAP